MTSSLKRRARELTRSSSREPVKNFKRHAAEFVRSSAKELGEETREKLGGGRAARLAKSSARELLRGAPKGGRRAKEPARSATRGFVRSTLERRATEVT